MVRLFIYGISGWREGVWVKECDTLAAVETTGILSQKISKGWTEVEEFLTLFCEFTVPNNVRGRAFTGDV